MNLEIQNSFKALADPTRRSILIHLSQKDMTIGEVTDQFDMTRAAVKKHLTVLESGRLISVESNGRERINKLETKGLKTISDYEYLLLQAFESGTISEKESDVLKKWRENPAIWDGKQN